MPFLVEMDRPRLRLVELEARLVELEAALQAALLALLEAARQAGLLAQVSGRRARLQGLRPEEPALEDLGACSTA